MSRVQLALRVGDLEGSIAFYAKLFGVEPAKRRPGYANFAIAEPPLKLVLLEGEQGQETVMDHLGVEVSSTGDVTAAAERLEQAGLVTFAENDTSCCYALQDKVWVRGPGAEPWEVYVVKADADTLGKSAAATATATATAGPAAPCACGPAAEQADGRNAPAASGTGCC
ncbi:ArsI/CadI family heavy metal resistance metalloenzyme [Nonomuraea roseoviolacea subsp. roseoviolacea]|uniref:Catechol 2,3-dioxygenase-like lactoylglutathione lyase family enzyme n=1 Tax=Nonomuraea roseoviolacea subsp. carminata TaxID=160689 RepID=A0ABT1K2D8_9ACTN|nr:ArsI/CadI family heavy metal resistance metalloenzyme [Nonomuraea roseoviolacea]MCP2347799.1 catechol 2,3-dioxygenase-like lactoylglutathione lyase family enzyme [Nonomuraea roseoviolacea subsp. carminata]